MHWQGIVGNQKLISVEKVLAGVLLALAVLSIIFVAFSFSSRIHYPYSLERMEGASLLEVERILDHRTLYSAPSITYIPLIYPPVYFYLSALVTKIMGLSFAPLRLVSIFAFSGCLIFIFLMIERLTKNKFASFIGMGFFAATYPLSGIWFDVARVDTLFVFFCIAAIWYSSKEDSIALFLSGLFWTLAVFTKQTALIALVLSFVPLLFFNFKQNIIRLAWTLLCLILAYLICTSLWGKMFSYYVFYLPSFHQMQDNYRDISNSVFQLVLPLLFLIPVSAIPFLLDKNMRSREPERYFGWMTLVLFGLSLMGRLNLGGFTNVYMPAHAMIAVMLGISLDWWRNKFNRNRTPSSSLYMSVLYLLYISQFVVILYDPRSIVPNQIQADEWSRFKAFIRQMNGDIFVPEINYLAALAGKPAFANQVAFDEILGAYGDEEPIQSNLLRGEVDQALQERQFDLVLLKNTDEIWKNVSLHYQCMPLSQTGNPLEFPSVVIQEYQACYPPQESPGSAGPAE